MNDKFGGHRPRPARSGSMGVLLAMLAVLGLALLAACSSASATASGGSSTSSAYAKALAYAQCIRAHGIPNYPDPNSKGQFVAQNGSNLPNVSSGVADAAAKACQKLQPPSMPGPQGGQQGGNTSQGLSFTACMRSHGEPNFPDPNPNGSFTLPSGMNAESPQFQNAERHCQSLMPMNPSGGSAP